MAAKSLASLHHCVIDASVAIKAFVDEEDSDKASALLDLLVEEDSALHVPELFYIEMTNILWKCVRQGRISYEDANANVQALSQLQWVPHPMALLIDHAFRLAHQYGMTAHVASYIALAVQLDLPFVTADETLQQKLDKHPARPLLLSEITF